MKTWKKSLEMYLDRRVLSIFFLGFSSGLPFLLILSTLSIWLKESGVSNTTIGLFVIATIPYTFKFLWGPMVDGLSIPFITKRLGKRRGWALLAQAFLMLSLLGLGSTNPEDNVLLTAVFAFLVAFFSALQDIVVEAYRIEIMDQDHVNVAASASYLGYRGGMLVSGAGALYLADIYSWSIVYSIMAAFVMIGIITTLLSPRTKTMIPSAFPKSSSRIAEDVSLDPRVLLWLKKTYLPPLKELLRKYDWRIVLAFILFYKVGDTVLNVMNTPFLVEMGYSKTEIAHVAKLFGIGSMIFGGVLGGVILNRFGILTSLILCGMLQILSSLMFFVQALVGYNIEVLIITIGVENFTCGLGAAAFIAYLSSMCSQPNTATHFALLSSFASLARIGISFVSGWMADMLPWTSFFLISAAASIPCVWLLIRSQAYFTKSDQTLGRVTA